MPCGAGGSQCAALALPAAAAALQLAPDTVGNCVAAISRVFMAAAKDGLGTRDFKSSLAPAELPAGTVTALAAAYKGANAELRERAREGASQLPSYHGFEWRLDVELSRRGAHQSSAPSYLLRVDTVQPAAGAAAGASPAPTSAYLQCDYANLKRLQTGLAAALAEADTTHTSRVERYVR